MNTDKLNNQSDSVIKNQNFLSKASLKPYVSGNALPRLSFVNCHFKDVFFPSKVLGTCSFKDCTFDNLFIRKGIFSGCRLENCKITDSNMTRTEFVSTYFKNCEFLNVTLGSSQFWKCKLEATKFIKSDLNYISADGVQVWKSNKWVEVEDFSSLQD